MWPSSAPCAHQWDVIKPCEPLPNSPDVERRFARGRHFEEVVVSKLRKLFPAMTEISGESSIRESRER